MPDTHAKLSASGSKRWMACPGSTILESFYEDTRSEYADEGTAAHALAEDLINATLTDNFTAVEKTIKRCTKEMLANVNIYVTYCLDTYTTLSFNHPDAVIMAEERVDFSNYVPDGFGTSDCIIIAGNRMIVVDLKYGKGVPIEAENNPQARLYAIGALNEYGWIYPIERITTVIVQPRLDSITTEELTVAELISWAEREIKPKARKASSGTREFNPGEHCQFCRARATCRARADKYLKRIEKYTEEF